MNNILKRLWVAVVIAIGIFIVGYLINGNCLDQCDDIYYQDSSV